MALRDKYDQFYDSSLEKEELRDVTVSGWPKNRVEAIVAMDGTGDRVLDIGCGNGFLLHQFRKRYKTLVGLEYSPKRLSQASINLTGLEFIPISGSAEDMVDIESNSIDSIISADTIEHIPDVYAAAAEMFRVLKPGGQLVINTPNIAFIKKRVLLLLGRFPSTSQPNEGIGSDVLFDGGHFHYFTYRSLRIVLENAGFTPVRRIGYGRFGRIHHVLPTITSGGVQWVMSKP
jgi:SAM-dependent methyltransferase